MELPVECISELDELIVAGIGVTDYCDFVQVGPLFDAGILSNLTLCALRHGALNASASLLLNIVDRRSWQYACAQLNATTDPSAVAPAKQSSPDIVVLGSYAILVAAYMVAAVCYRHGYSKVSFEPE